jgi:hypothetical protein
MHALIVQADDKLCKAASATYMKCFRQKIEDGRTALWSEQALVDVSVSLWCALEATTHILASIAC